MATQDGLARFDGNTFLPYTKQSLASHRISGPDIRKIIESPEHDILWVLLNNNNLDAVSTQTGNVLYRIPLSNLCNEDWSITMTGAESELWIGTFCGLRVFDTKSLQFTMIAAPDASAKKHESDFEVNCVAIDGFNNVWACYSGYGIVIYDGRTLKKIKEIKLRDLKDNLGSKLIRFNAYTLLNNHEILFATSQGLRKISFDKNYALKIDNAPCRSLPLMNSSAVETIAQAGPGEILVSGNDHLYRFDPSLKTYLVYDENIAPAESKWIGSVQSIYHEGNITWLGCQQGIAMLKNNHNPFTRYFYDEGSGNKLGHVRSLCVLPNQDILCGLSSGLAYIRRADGSFEMKDRLHLYHHIFADRSGIIHLFRDDGMFALTNKGTRPVTDLYPEFETYKSNTVNSHLFLGDSAVLMGTEDDNGVLLWNYRKHTIVNINVSTKPALASGTVNNIYQDKKDRIWVLSNYSITLLDGAFTGSKVMNFANNPQFPKPDLFFDMCETKHGYWIASYGNGVLQVDDNCTIKKILDPAGGLCNAGVYNIFNIGDSDLVVTTNIGLSVYGINSQKFKSYYKDDGLHSNAFEEVAAAAHENKLYAGGIDGFTLIDPSRFTINTDPPKFYFTEVKIKTTDSTHNIDTANLEMTSVTVPNNWLLATISFTGMNYSNPARVRYKYRIIENDTNYTGIGNQHFISLIGLSPGTYNLEIQSENEDHYWSVSKTLTLTIEPKWYQTWEFYTFLLVSVLGLFYALYRYRITQIKAQQRQLQQVREEIAGDLHDDIGGTLNSIKIFTHLAEELPEEKNYFTYINDSLKLATEGLRDIIWVLDDKNDTIDDLMERLQRFTQPVAEAIGIHIHFTTTATAGVKLHKTEKRNLLMIGKEAINNSIKYAACKEIQVLFRKVDGYKNFSVSDDGKGFAEDEIVPGNGLINIRSRARQIKYTASIQSTPLRGTTVLLISLT